MTSKQDTRADEVLRSLRSVSRIEGLVVADAAGLRLFVRAAVHAGVAHAASRRLLRGELGEVSELAHLFGASEVVELDAGTIGQWAYDLAQLDNRRDVEALIGAGARALRRYRGRDVRAELAERRVQLGRHRLLLPAHVAAKECLSRGGAAPTAEQMVAALPVRMHALADWQVDPVVRLSHRSVAASGLLVQAAMSDDDDVAALAATLLAMRHRTGPPDDRARQRGALPGALVPIFDLAIARPPRSPVLFARAAAASRRVPDIAFVPIDDRTRIESAAERVAVVVGLDAALDAIAHLAEPYTATENREWERRLFRFAGVCAGRVREVPAEQALAARLRQMPGNAAGRARLLAAEMLDWMRDASRPDLVDRDRLIRIARSEDADVTGAALAMCRQWRDERLASPDPPETNLVLQTARLAISIAHPSASLRLGRGLAREELAGLTELLVSLPTERCAALFDAITSEVRRRGFNWGSGQLISGPASPALVARALGAGVASAAAIFAKSPRMLRAYVECVEQLLPISGARLWLESDWFARIFAMGRTWSSAMVLALVARTKGGGDNALDASALFGVSAALETDTELAAAIDEWATIRVDDPPPETAELAELIGAPVSLLHEYLHFRRGAGEGETFSAAVLVPLRAKRKLSGQIEYLERALAGPAGPSARVRDSMEKRLANLREDDRQRARNRRETQQAKRTLTRSLKSYREASLDVSLDAACARAVSRVIGRHVELPLPEGLRDAFHLLHAQQIAMPLLRAFLSDVLQRRPLADREENREWLARARAAGIDTDVWMRGVSFEVTVRSERVVFSTETDPLHLLKMGSYFGTCLSLDEGFNAASTLINALDVNKHVIYGRRRDGTVVARKLIGARATGQLAGYQTYGVDGGEDHKAPLDAALADFADRCGLHLSDTATPETLHAGFWYDDGNEGWQRGRTAPLRPAPAGLAPGAASQWNLREAIIEGDVDRLESVARNGSGMARAAAAYRLFLEHPARAAGLADAALDPDVVRTVGELLTARGNLDWLAVGKKRNLDNGRVLAVAMPADAAGATRCARAMRDMPRVFDDEPVAGSSINLALVPQALAVKILVKIWREMVEYHGVRSAAQRAPGMAWILIAMYARASDRRGLCRELVREPDLAPVLIAAAELLVIPELAPWLRKCLLGASLQRAEDIALALGNLADPSDGARLLGLLRRWPDSLGLAVAIARTGDAEAAQEARARWVAPDDLLAACDDPEVCARIKELEPADVGRRLRRIIVRALGAGDGHRASSALEHLGKLSIPGYRLADLATVLPGKYRAALRRAADASPSCAPVPAAVARSRQIDAILSGSDLEQAQAVGEFLEHDGRSELRARFVRVLLADRTVGETTRKALAPALFDRANDPVHREIDAAIAVIAWHERAPLSERGAAIVACARSTLGELDRCGIHALLELEGDGELFALAAGAYATLVHSGDESGIAALNAAMFWLHPTTAERLARDALPAARDAVRAVGDLRKCLDEEDLSYRLVELLEASTGDGDDVVD